MLRRSSIGWSDRSTLAGLPALGDSLGAQRSLAAAAEDPRIRALVLDSMHAEAMFAAGNIMQTEYGLPPLPGALAIVGFASLDLHGDVAGKDPLATITRSLDTRSADPRYRRPDRRTGVQRRARRQCRESRRPAGRASLVRRRPARLTRHAMRPRLGEVGRTTSWPALLQLRQVVRRLTARWPGRGRNGPPPALRRRCVATTQVAAGACRRPRCLAGRDTPSGRSRRLTARPDQ